MKTNPGMEARPVTQVDCPLCDWPAWFDEAQGELACDDCAVRIALAPVPADTTAARPPLAAAA